MTKNPSYLHFNQLLMQGLLMLNLAGCTHLPNQTKLASLEQGQMAYLHTKPTHPLTTTVVVFQSGLGDDKSVWQPVLQRLGAQVASFSYDRFGYGASTSFKGSRDPCQIAHEQHELLKRAGIKAPYILVGHSLGGLYEYVYATLYPEEVAGLVLLDPTHPQHWQRIQTELPHIAVLLSSASLLFSKAARQEFNDQKTCLNQLKPELNPNIPVRLLVSSQRQALEKGRFETLLQTLRLDWQRLTHAPAIQSLDTGHYIQTEQPAAVVTAIHQLLKHR